MKIAILSINKPSFSSAINLDSYLTNHNTDIYLNQKTNALIQIKEFNNHNLNIYEKLDDILGSAWKKYDAIICILAIGAVVRKIAPYLHSKETDPAVLVLNLELNKIIPLLSGHLGGANKLSDEICNKINNCVNFISTATDQTKTLAFEIWAKERNMTINNIKQLANISNRLINKQTVNVSTHKSIFQNLKHNPNLIYQELLNISENTVVITPFNIETKELYFKTKIFLGIGCNRDTTKQTIQNAIYDFLLEHKLDFEQISSISSFEAKNDEIGLLDFISEQNIKLNFFNKDDINALEEDFSKSASTKFFGLKGVAEPSAILASKFKELLIRKTVYYKSVTIACAI